MHRAVKDKRLKQRLLNKKRERGENVINFTEGDYVLRSRVDEKSGNKLLVTWVGPYRVLRADAHSFLIQHLITGAELDVHASRLKFYADASLDVTEELREHISSQGIVLAIEKLKEHRWNDQIRDYEVLVQWKGLEAIEDSYEPLTSLARDVPVLVAKYVATADQGLQEHWQRQLLAAKDSDRMLTPPLRRRPSLHGRTVADKVDSNNADRQPSRNRLTTRRPKFQRPLRVPQLPLCGKQWSDLDLNSNQTRLPLRCHLMQLVTEDAVHRGASRVQDVGRFKSRERQPTSRRSNVLCKQGRGQAMI
ncbi:hypothetical protein PF004_g27615 [Phytophthora fragariae]|uniref:Chromo domain-containing protein n=1 Tax=Phytophthora fragariae TaxID=53985 RepID=A0A6G0ML56_9STRA|nr:hypothetical protein PF004_g27615 [Phytophthora fragariae]